MIKKKDLLERISRLETVNDEQKKTIASQNAVILTVNGKVEEVVAQLEEVEARFEQAIDAVRTKSEKDEDRVPFKMRREII